MDRCALCDEPKRMTTANGWEEQTASWKFCSIRAHGFFLSPRCLLAISLAARDCPSAPPRSFEVVAFQINPNKITGKNTPTLPARQWPSGEACTDKAEGSFFPC